MSEEHWKALAKEQAARAIVESDAHAAAQNHIRVLRARVAELEARIRELERIGGAEKRVLVELASALRRLGDDPPYYEVHESEGDADSPWPDLFALNPRLVDALNAWTVQLGGATEVLSDGPARPAEFAAQVGNGLMVGVTPMMASSRAAQDGDAALKRAVREWAEKQIRDALGALVVIVANANEEETLCHAPGDVLRANAVGFRRIRRYLQTGAMDE